MASRSLLFVLLVVWGGLMMLISWMIDHDPSQRRPEFLMDMAHSPAYEAMEPNPVFADGRTLRPPVAETIARGFLPFRYGPSAEECARAGRELENPFPAGPEVAARGRFVFENFCAICHGADGLGEGAVSKRGVPPPPSLLAAGARKLKDGQMYHVITLGRGNMPPHAAQVSRDDRWKVIRFIRELQGGE